MSQEFDRRDFLAAGAAVTASSLFACQTLLADADKKYPRLRKAVKFGMIRAGNTVKEKFELIKSLGFQGVEVDSPGNWDRQEMIAARDATGIDIHGVIDSIHWQTRLSDPNPEIREKGLAALQTALRDAKFVGASTVLLVPGKVADPDKENFDQVWERSQSQVRKALPLAEEVGVKIAIEVVWNDFITKPEELIKYVDEFKSPYVGAYFDCSNMLKYGVPSAEWILQLGTRMLKFDFKGYSHEKKWVAIGEGDENWPEVLKALAEIKYDGWATSEVAGGGEKELRDIAQRMNKVLSLES